jgi:8-oxo-dGTP pyrophosphatase MutT (NUDIX family)
MSPRQPGTRPLARVAPPTARQAAALILLYPGTGAEGAPDGGAEDGQIGDWCFPLTIRHDDLLHHPGQISLPGGGVDAGETLEAAALREAHEEIGLDPSTVRILGSLTPLYVIVSGYVVTPFVGVVATRPRFHPEVREVAEILEVRVADLLSPARVAWGIRSREGYVIDFPYYALGTPPTHQVWGATAMMLSEFVQLVS